MLSAATGLALLAWLYFCNGARAPSSIAEAIERRPSEFPPPFHALVPPASADPLGSKAEVRDGRRLVVKSAPCFHTFSTASPGLDVLDIDYSSSAKLLADFGPAAEQLGISADDVAQAKLRFRNLSVVTSVGVPNLTACDFTNEATLEVVTSFIRAETATLIMRSKSSGKTAAGAQREGGRIEGGWNEAKQGEISGRNIVLAAKLSKVSVRVWSEHHDLTASPKAGTALTFPPGFDGSVKIVEYLPPEGLLRIQAQAPFQMGAPEGKAPLCRFGDEFDLKEAVSCMFVFQPGNAAVAVSWQRLTDAAGAPTVVLHMKGYKTAFDSP